MSHQIRVFYAINDTPLSSSLWEQYLLLLPTAQQESVLRYHRWEDRQASLLGKLLLLKAFSDEDDYDLNLKDIKYNAFNKPYVENSLSFNITHSGGYVICAVSKECQIGIDIEFMKQGISLGDFDEIFSDREWQKIHYAPNPLHAFYNLWTQKESVMKADGRGLSVPLKAVQVNDKFIFLEGKRWFKHELVIHQDYKCFLACDQPVYNVDVQGVSFGETSNVFHPQLQQSVEIN